MPPSTLVRCINRLVEPTAGEILFEGRDLVKLDRGELRLARRHIGMVFQEYNLVERLSVMENLLSGRLGYELVQKAIVLGVPIVAAVSAPSSLAIELAERFNVALVGFVRGERANVYAHGWRIR